MAALVCLKVACGAVYSVGAPRCPQCGGTAGRSDWDEPADAAPSASPAAGTGAVVLDEPGPELVFPIGGGSKVVPPAAGGDTA